MVPEKQKILIADDSEMNRTLLVEMLKDNFEIAEVENGAQALAALQENPGEFSLLLLDIVMPGMDGFEVLRKRQRSEIFKNIPVIVLTMSDMKEDQELAEQLGADGFLLKPVNPKDAHFRIRQVLGE